MTLPVEKMKLSDKELNCMKMCQKAPKCADFFFLFFFFFFVSGQNYVIITILKVDI